MYEAFYGLTELPFELTANPKYLFLAARQREALSVLQYGLFSAKSITVLLGEAGTGKTTLIRAALGSERCRDVRCIYLNNPAMDTEDFVKLLAIKFGLGPDAGASKPILLERLESVLLERRARGEITALVIDEAQTLSVELLEEIRLLANIETASAKLLPLVLAGQPELALRLEDHNLRQLKQRITLRCQLEPFDLQATAAYIASRIAIAGGVATRVFSFEAVALIHEHSGGIPRSVNVICDNALVNGMALGRHQVDRAIVDEVCRDLRLQSSRERYVEAALHTLAQEPARSLPHPDAVAESEATDDPETDSEAVTPSSRNPFRRRKPAVPARNGRMITE
jgi:general secretion pathway protein A